ncbi:hypothetical protein L1049_009955 [Liquidambar formosana]|uniref:Cytochrome P450 n=1 Tax=Liquidambar formosana TaxID=63359 RepID=A0AAP0N6N3_LIQFO
MFYVSHYDLEAALLHLVETQDDREVSERARDPWPSLQGMLPAFSICCDEMIEKWEKLVGLEGSSELDVSLEFQKLTADAISRAAFGSSFEQGRQIFQLQKEQCKLYMDSYYMTAYPWLRFLPTKTNARMREIYREVQVLLEDIIEQRKKDIKMGSEVKDDLLGLLLESNQAELRANGGSKNSGMTTKDVIEECKLFYFAGQETVANMLTWTTVILSVHSEWQDQARAEVLKLVGKSKPSFDDLTQLKIVTMILKEALRLYPPTSLIRNTYRRTKLGEYSLPAGVQIVVPLHLVHRDPELWGEDVLEFNPRRFSEGVSKATKDQISYYPFGGGPRICIGQNFAMLEIKMALVRMLQNFSFEISPSYAHAPGVSITLQPLYGKLFFVWFGPVPQLVVMEPELIKEILNNKSGDFGKMQVNSFTKLFTNGLANIDCEIWAKHRKIINPSFHMEKLKRMLPAFSICCDEMIEKWEKLVGLEGSCELDVQNEFQILTGDVISRAAFGSNFEEGRRIFHLQKEQGDLFVKSFYMMVFPWLRFLPKKSNARMREIYKEVGVLLKGIIEKRQKAMKTGNDVKDDLLGFLLESNLAEFHENQRSKNSGMTIEEVIDECKLFYFAGQETTANLLTWTIIILSVHSDWQEQAREEVLKLIGKRKPSFDELAQLKTVTMILQEVLRLYPPTTLVRRTNRRTKLQGFSLPAGVRIFIPAHLVHRDPEVWGEDVMEFNPRRFSEGVLNASKDQFSYFPFGWGPRICIGQNFAMVEAKMVLARILQNFSFEISPSYVHAPAIVITLQPLYGAQVIFHKL